MENSTERENPSPQTDNQRYKWIDQARGFIMFYLVVTTVFPPSAWKPEGSILFWLFEHPSPDALYMTLFDVGAAAFIFVLGMLFTVSFAKRRERKGTKEAVLYVAKRYGLLLLLGFLIIVADGEFIYENRGYTVVSWDVIPTLGLVGFVAIPFAFIKDNKIRLIVAYAWMVLYQILMNYADLKGYAKASVHGGIFGPIFGFSGIMIVAACLGEYIFLHQDSEPKKYKNMAIFGAINFVVGLILSWLPDLEASKRQVSLSYCLLSIGTTVLGLMVFILMDKIYHKEVKLFTIYGKNPFFTYFLAAVPVFILDETTGDDLGLGPIGNIIVLAVLLTYTSLILWNLEKKQKTISTEKAALIFIVVAAILAAILIGFGII